MTEPPGLYIHVPFCKTKCPYCDFYSVTDLSLVDKWVEAILREATLFGGAFHNTFDTLYIGGGTPSVMNDRQMETLVEGVREIISFTADTEITIEVNPDDVTREQLLFLRSRGVNRVSVGVQSFRDDELLFLGRRHDASTAEKVIDLIRSAGFENFSMDIMYGLPGQAEDAWIESLERAVSYDPPHLSCYQLCIEEGTPWGALEAAGKICSPGECEGKNLFIAVSRFLRKKGFTQYEISNFSRGKRNESRHNRKYWRHTSYLGLGPGAHSFHGNVRRWNVRSVETYIETIMKDERAVDGLEVLSHEQLKLERLFLGFRTNRGVSMEDIGDDPAALETLSRLRSSRIVTIRQGRVIPTLKGFLIADHLPLMFS